MLSSGNSDPDSLQQSAPWPDCAFLLNLEGHNGIEPSPATNQWNSFQGCLLTMNSIPHILCVMLTALLHTAVSPLYHERWFKHIKLRNYIRLQPNIPLSCHTPSSWLCRRGVFQVTLIYSITQSHIEIHSSTVGLWNVSCVPRRIELHPQVYL